MAAPSETQTAMNMAITDDRQGSFLVTTFLVGETLLGIATLKVQEVVRPMDITVVHHAMSYITGIINLRGRIVTIIDLAKRLKLAKPPEEGASRNSRIIIVDWKGEYVGMWVDAVAEVMTVYRDKVQAAPANIQGVQGKYFEGVYNTEKELLALLNIEEIFSDEEKK